MKTRFLLVLFSLVMSICATAQDSSRVQIFAGYSRTGYSVYQLYSGPWQSYGFNGGDGSVAFKIQPNLAIEADFAGAVGSNGTGQNYNLRTYMGGPKVYGDFGRVGVYGHVLFGALIFGGASGYSNGSPSFAAAVGAGVDLWFSRHIGVRPIQADFLYNKNASAAQSGTPGSASGKNYRIAAGIVLRF